MTTNKEFSKYDAHVHAMLDVVDDFLSNTRGYVLIDIAYEREHEYRVFGGETPYQAAMKHAVWALSEFHLGEYYSLTNNPFFTQD